MPIQKLSEARERLVKAGLRITRQRMSALEVLIRLKEPATIEAIHAELSEKSFDLVTVYRNMDTFESIGLVRRFFQPNGTSLLSIELGASECAVVSRSTGKATLLEKKDTTVVRELIAKVEQTLKARGYGDLTHVCQFFVD